ncbi:hypothetical protein IU433_13345 [Nocardia puris]|uniref:Uncharacterized protein n=1 Tax=Nocardia puris TaxID=208602 RepID=A0A366DN41_9NOCA|nr:hypothetical protein [Nocardia puris]MBF6213512.1 hypothetical protein [Nocardia puris]MBF6365558.1 hypothetical protein [Nocardia puris]MBF6460024.1 hypothetical protein [Nocardia puris]RBO91492.1 hypothetical protein DFR74_104194 [Nocardia puris]
MEVRVRVLTDGSIAIAPAGAPTVLDDAPAPDTAVLEVAGGHLTWSLLAGQRIPAAVLDNADAAQDWLWALYGERVAVVIGELSAPTGDSGGPGDGGAPSSAGIRTTEPGSSAADGGGIGQTSVGGTDRFEIGAATRPRGGASPLGADDHAGENGGITAGGGVEPPPDDDVDAAASGTTEPSGATDRFGTGRAMRPRSGATASSGTAPLGDDDSTAKVDGGATDPGDSVVESRDRATSSAHLDTADVARSGSAPGEGGAALGDGNAAGSGGGNAESVVAPGVHGSADTSGTEANGPAVAIDLLVEPALPEVVGRAWRLAYAHWAARWWPASTVDGIPALDQGLLAREIATLTEECELLVDGADAEVATEDVVAEPLSARAEDYALAAGGARGGGLAFGRGIGGWDWWRCPPGLVDASERAVSWDLSREAGATVARVQVVAAPTLTSAPDHLRPRAAFTTPAGNVTADLTLRGDTWYGETPLPADSVDTVEVYVPGVGATTRTDPALRQRIRDFATTRVRRASAPDDADPPLLAEIAAAAGESDF